MDPATIVMILEAAFNLTSQAYDLYQKSQTVLSETDAATVHAALLKAEAAMLAMRSQVDAALSAAAANKS